MQLAWANAIPGRVLILAPLCVAEQTVLEGQKFGVDVAYATSQPETRGARIVITNYERLAGFDPSCFDGVVLDESSILKAFDGKTRARLIDAFKDTRYRLCCTATPSPNDIAELGNHAEFLGLMTRAEFLSTWFVHDDQGWRMKGHAVQPFYRWLASWAIAMRKPSDIGYSDEGYELPPLTITDHVVEGGDPGGVLFPELGLKGIQGRQKARRASVQDRVAEAIGLMLKSVYDEREEGRILPTVAEEKQSVGASLSYQSGERGEATSMGQEEIPDEQGCSGQGNRSSEVVCQVASASEEALEYAEIRADAGAIRRDDVLPGELLRDLRPRRKGKAVSLRRPLSQDEASQRAALYKLQSRYRQIQGQPSAPGNGHRIPKWIAWCGLNVEQDTLESILGESLCVSVSGTDSMRDKSRKIMRWITDPNMPIMLTKGKIAGFGLNFQHCHNTAFVGIGDSYEQYYQMIRRCWRFGQQHPVHAHIVVSNSERAIVSNVRRKQADADEMARQLLVHMREFERMELSA